MAAPPPMVKIPVIKTSPGLSIIALIASRDVLGLATSTAHIRRQESPMNLPRKMVNGDIVVPPPHVEPFF
jgi:hypothetical protein